MLKYTGNGSLAGIPARDLREDEIKEVCDAVGITRKFLIDSGLYVEDKTTLSDTKISVSDDVGG